MNPNDTPVWILTVQDSLSLPPGHPPVVSAFLQRHVAMRRASERMLGHVRALISTGVPGLSTFAGQVGENLALADNALVAAFTAQYEEWVRLMATGRLRMFMQVQQQYPCGDSWDGRRQFVTQVIQALGDLALAPLPRPDIVYRELGTFDNLATHPTYHVTLKPVTNLVALQRLITNYMHDPIEVIESSSSVLEVWRHFPGDPSFLVRLIFAGKPGEPRKWADHHPSGTVPAWQKPAAAPTQGMDEADDFLAWLNKAPIRTQLYAAGVALEYAALTWKAKNTAPDSVARARVALETLNEWLECTVPAGKLDHWARRLVEVRPNPLPDQASDSLAYAAGELTVALQTASAREPFEALLTRTPGHIRMRSDLRDARAPAMNVIRASMGSLVFASLEPNQQEGTITQQLVEARAGSFTDQTNATMRERLSTGEPYRVRPETLKE